MPTLTQISGYLFDATGTILLQGSVTLTLQQDIVSVDSTKVAPFAVMVDLSLTSGFVDVSVYATVGASPAGVAYFVEFDPDPDDTTRPARTKDGYWNNYWSVPNAPSLPLGTFTTALRGETSTNYMPLGGDILWSQMLDAPVYDDGSSGTAKTINFSLSSSHQITLTGNVTLTLSNPVDGGRYFIFVRQGAGSNTVTWPSTVRWPGGTTPTMTAGAGKVSIVALNWVAALGRYIGSSDLDYTV